MKIARFLFAGAMLSSAVLAQQGDPGAAERFRMKFGRSTAGESSRKASTAGIAGHSMPRAACDCCHGKHAS